MLAGVAWTASGVVGAASASGRGPQALGAIALNEALCAVALAGTLGGLVGLHARQAAGYGWLGKTGFLVSFVGTTLLLAGLVLSLLARALAEAPVGGGAPGPAFPDRLLWLGLWGTLFGFALLGTATLRLGALPRWCGWLLIVCLPLAIAAPTTPDAVHATPANTAPNAPGRTRSEEDAALAAAGRTCIRHHQGHNTQRR